MAQRKMPYHGNSGGTRGQSIKNRREQNKMTPPRWPKSMPIARIHPLQFSTGRKVA